VSEDRLDADPDELITDPDEKSLKEAENAFRQIDFALELVRENLSNPDEVSDNARVDLRNSSTRNAGHSSPGWKISTSSCRHRTKSRYPARGGRGVETDQGDV
jgi:hypothetical protein